MTSAALSGSQLHMSHSRPLLTQAAANDNGDIRAGISQPAYLVGGRFCADYKEGSYSTVKLKDMYYYDNENLACSA